MWFLNPRPNRDAAAAFFSPDELRDVRAYYARAALPPTPLRSLPGLAAELGLGELLVKDETHRFGLPAFKIVGAQYAIARLVRQHGPRLMDVACATAGNHGRAVAQAARDHGLLAHVYVPLSTPRARIDAIAACGAHVVITSADYDDTVRLMADDARSHGWTIVSDTGWAGHDAVPRAIMAGYTWIFDEAARQWAAAPDVVVVQAGVGGLAAAAAAWFAVHAPDTRVVVAEPEGSACVQASLRAGQRVALSECAPTSMTCLRCGEVSDAAWPALRDGVYAAVAISDVMNGAALQRLAMPAAGDSAILAGPSGGCGVAALFEVVADRELRAQLRVGAGARTMAIATEAATGSARPVGRGRTVS